MTLRTSLTGSYPPIKQPGTSFYLLSQEEQDKFVNDSIERAINTQVQLEIDMLVDGQARDDIVSLFARNLPGFIGQALPFQVIAPIRSAEKPITVKDYTYAQQLAGNRQVKSHITGPMTMARSARIEPGSGYKDRNDPQFVVDLASALAEEAKQLVEAGAKIIQIDEPVLSDGVDLGLAFEAMEEIARIAEVPTLALHACGNVTMILSDILQRSPVKIVSIEGSWLQHEELHHIDQEYLAKCNKQIALGCIKVGNYTIERLTRVQDFLDRMIIKLGAENIWAVTPNCGMRLMPHEVAVEKLRVMVEAAKSV